MVVLIRFLEIARENGRGYPSPPGGGTSPHRRSTCEMIPLPLGGRGPPVATTIDLPRRDNFGYSVRNK
jgi:hypothetical protein